MKRLLIAAALLPAALLCGCQQPVARQLPSTTAPAAPERPVSQQLSQLWMEGNLNPDTPLPVMAIRADSDRLSFSWNGDAVELLNALARARGQVFSYAGVRLPLPVDIEVQGVTYASVLRMIEMQPAWRATIVTYPGQMVLQFMSSLPAEPVRHKKGGRR